MSMISMVEFAKQMKLHFGITTSNTYLDARMSLLKRSPTIDIFKFDDWLHEKHGDYEDSERDCGNVKRPVRGLSMAQLVEREYGVVAVNFIKSVM